MFHVVTMADLSSFTDEQLASAELSADGGEMVAELISRYSNTVFRMAAKFADLADYEELVSDGLDALLNAVSNYDSEKGSFGAFASVCISNRMKNTADRAARRKARLASAEALDALTDTAPTPEEIVILKENTSEMSGFIRDMLTPLERRCLNGVILGMSYADIAERIGVSAKSVDNAVARARAKLRSVYPEL